jgi:hypothetical protein
MALFDNNPLYKNISSLTNPVTSGLGNLFEGMNVFGARPSEALTGILTKEQQDKLKNQALFQGLLGTAATYLATPKNLNVGSALPYLGKAFLGGMQSSQGAYDTALTGKVKQLELEQGARKLEMEGLTPIEKLMKRRETLSTVKDTDTSYSNAQNQIKILDQAIAKESGGLAGFGAGVEGSSLNLLARGSQNTPEGEAIRKTPAYALAHREATSPKTIMQETMDANGNVYTVPVKINQSALPSNILPPIYGEQGVTTQPVDMTQPQITTKPGQVTQPTQPSASTTTSPNIKKFGQTKQDIFKQEQDTRKDYMATPEVKNFGEVRSAYNTIDVGLKEKSPAGDLTAATKFMKLLDPTSVVRETELAMAMNATGLVDKAQFYFDKLLSGEKLSDPQRADFRSIATKLYKAAESVKNNYDAQYVEIAKSNNLDPSKIVMGYKDNKPSPQIRNKADILKEYGVK